jgi:hypothetical protein
METQRFIVNDAGERVAVIIDLAEYMRVLEDLEELESIRQYDAARADPDAESIPFEQAVREIERTRR